MTIPMSERREFLGHIAAAGVGAAIWSPSFAQKPEGSTPATGIADPNLESFDRLMTTFLEEHKVPGAALAVARRGKLVYARGFAHADVEKKEPVQPAALFRIASVSKPVTAVAVLQLVEQGKLALDAPILDVVKLEPHLEPGAKLDPRWKQVTVLQLLRHTGGWDRSKSFDPIGIPWDIAKSMKMRPPVQPEHIVRYMLGKPLDFDPGQRHAYSNLGYLLLGRALETVTRQPYEALVRKHVLAPLGIRDMRLGKALLENRARGEVRYHDSRKRVGSALVGPRIGERVPAQYGADNLEAYEAHGGWIASAPDLVRFASAFAEPAQCPLLKEKTVRTMWSRPAGAAGHDTGGKPRDAYYGCGWSVRPVGREGKVNAWHTGLIGGTSTLLVLRWDGLAWAVLFNTDRGASGKILAGAIDPLVHQAADKVQTWPGGDLFRQLGERGQ